MSVFLSLTEIDKLPSYELTQKSVTPKLYGTATIRSDSAAATPPSKTIYEAFAALPLLAATAAAISSDPITSAKILAKYAKGDSHLKIVAGFMDGKVLEDKDVDKIATLPTLDEARAKIVGILRSPAQKIASILLAPASKIAILALEKSKK